MSTNTHPCLPQSQQARLHEYVGTHAHLRAQSGSSSNPYSDKGKILSTGRGHSPLSTPDSLQLKATSTRKELPLTSSLPPGLRPGHLLPPPQPISGQALAVTLSREVKDEGGGRDVPGASLAMRGVSVETRGGPYPDDYRGSQSSLSLTQPLPARPPWL